MRRSTFVLPLLACAAVACSAPAPPAQPENRGFGHVHGVGLNPGDGLVYAATHFGVFRLGDAGPERVGDNQQDTMGFTIAGPDLFLGSGHPGSTQSGPPDLGFITSTDRAQSWRSVALAGEVDFHVITASRAVVYGLNSRDSTILRSDDGGTTWQRGARLAATDVDVDPSDPLHTVATTETGLQESTDGGLTFRPLTVQPPELLQFVDHVEYTGDNPEPRLVGVDPNGGVWALTAGTWNLVGSMPGAPPQAFSSEADDRYLGATAAGIVATEDGGRTWSLIAPSSS